MRVLVIGGTGLIGPFVVQGLQAAGHDVVTLNRSGTPAWSEPVVAGDRRNAAILRLAVERAAPALVAASSMDVYRVYGLIHGTETGPQQPAVLTEDSPLRTAYGPEGAAYDKIGVERVYQEALSDVVILRFPVVYGWPDVTRVEPLLAQMLDGAEQIEITRARSGFCIARSLHRNAAWAAVLAATRATPGHHIYNVAEERFLSELEWAERIAEACGWRGKLVITAQDDGDARHQFKVSSAKIREKLGYAEPHDPKAGFNDMVAFYSYQRRGKPYKKFY